MRVGWGREAGSLMYMIKKKGGGREEGRKGREIGRERKEE